MESWTNKQGGSTLLTLGVNIDHVATIRQARRTVEPDPVAAAVLAEIGALMALPFTCARIVVISRIAMCGFSGKRCGLI